MTERTVRPLPGGGIVARYGDLVIACEPAGADELLGLASTATDARDLAIKVSNWAFGQAATGPAVAFTGPAPDGRTVVLAYGAAVAEVVVDGVAVAIEGDVSDAPVLRIVAGSVDAIALRLPGAGTPNAMMRLDGGVVSGGGAEITGDGAPMRPVVLDPKPPATAPAPPAPAPPAPAPPAPAPPAPAPPAPARTQAPPPAPAPPVTPAPRPAPLDIPTAPHDIRDDEATDAMAAQPHGGMPGAQSAPLAQPVDPFSDPVAPPPPSRPVPYVGPGGLIDVIDELTKPQPQVPGAPAGPAIVPDPPSIRQPNPAAKFEAFILVPGVSQLIVEPATPAVPARALVEGVSCAREHFNKPGAPYCQVCGIGLVQLTQVPRLGPRPPLGVLILDNSMTFQLDDDYIVGREPQIDSDVIGGTARPLVVADTEGVVSRRHARIHLNGWEVEVLDLGSANGTYIQQPGTDSYQRLVAGQPAQVRPGALIVLGRRRLRFESHLDSRQPVPGGVV